MAKLETVIEIKVDGKQAEGFLADLNENAKGFAENLKSLGGKIEAVESLGFGKALAQGFLKSKDEIVSVAKVLEMQLAQTKPGAAYEAISKNLEAAQKELQKFEAAETKAANERAKAEAERVKAAEKAEAEILKNFEKSLKEKEKAEKDAAKEAERLRREGVLAQTTLLGVNEALKQGAIQNGNDLKNVVADLKKARDASGLLSEEWIKYDEALQEATRKQKILDNVIQGASENGNELSRNLIKQFTVINQETGEATINIEGLTDEYTKLGLKIEDVTAAVEELDLTADNVSVAKLQESLNDISTTQLEKELDGLQEKIKLEDVGSQAFVELQQKIGIIKNEIDDRLKPAFKDLAETELDVSISNASKKELEKNIESLQGELNSLNPNSARFKELNEVLKKTKAQLIEVELQSEVIAKLDISQAYIDLATKTAEGFNNATTAIGSFAGETEVAGEATAELEKFLQALAVVQSIQDGFRAYSESLKGASVSSFGLSSALKVLKFALAATGIGAIALVLGALVSQFGGLNKVLGVITDGLAAAQDAFKIFSQSLDFSKILDKIVSAGKLIFKAYTAPYEAGANFVKDILSGKGLSESLSKAKDTLVKPFAEIKDAFVNAGSGLADAFGKAFDARQGLRENEKKKKLLETLNAERAARKSAIDAELGDETNGFEQRKKLLTQAAALEQAAIADSLALNKERIKLLESLGGALSDEQRQEIRDLKAESAQQIEDLEAARIAAAQAQRDLTVEQQDFLVSQLQAAAEFEIGLKERTLAKGVALQKISSKEEAALLDEITAKRLSVLEAEQKAIKSRGKLTKDEAQRLVEIENEITNNKIENEDRKAEASQRRIDEELTLNQKLLETEQLRFENTLQNEEELATQQEAGNKATEKQLETLNKRFGGFDEIEQRRKAAADALLVNYKFQEAAILRQAEAEKKRLAFQEDGIQLQIDAIKKREESRELTAQETAELENLQAQLESIGKQKTNVDVTVTSNLQVAKGEFEQGVADAATQAKDEIQQMLADPLGFALRDAITSGLKIDDAQAQQLIDSASQVKDAILSIVETFNQARIEAIDAELETIASQKEAIDTELESIKSEIEETQSSLDELSRKALESQGAQRAALLAQLDAQKAKTDELRVSEKKKLDEKVQAEKKEAQLLAEKEKREKQAAKIALAIETAKAWATFAVAISKAAASTAWPANLAAIATTVTAGGGAISSTISLAKFRKGGLLKASKGALLEGPSHEQGGIPLFKNGSQIAEVEGGEAIITARATKDPVALSQLSAINQRFGGVPLMADGGLAPTDIPLPTTDMIMAKMNEQLQAFANRPVIVDFRDVTAAQERVQVIENASSY